MTIYVVRIDTAAGENFLHAFSSMENALRFYDERSAAIARDCNAIRRLAEAWCHFPVECVLDEAVPSEGMAA